MTDRSNRGLARWHDYVSSKDVHLLADQIADDAVFISPVVHTPQRGKQVTLAYLVAALEVLGNGTFHYTRRYVSDTGAVMEFVTDVDGISINGIDMIEWNADGHICEFKVMVRPLQAVNLLHRKMGEMLARMKQGGTT